MNINIEEIDESMSKKSNKKSTNSVSSIDELTMPIVDLSDDVDGNVPDDIDGNGTFSDDDEVKGILDENFGDSAHDNDTDGTVLHPDITSNDLDAYLSDGAISNSAENRNGKLTWLNHGNDDTDDSHNCCGHEPLHKDEILNMLDILANIDGTSTDDCEVTTGDESTGNNDNRHRLMTDNERLLLHTTADEMENIEYDEIPANVKAYDDMLDAALQLRHETAEVMYDTGEAYRYADNIDMRAFMSYGSTVPFMMSEPVDKLCIKYGLGIHDATDYDRSISNSDDYAWKRNQARGLLWSEILPTGAKSELRKEHRANPNAAEIDEAIAERYMKGRHVKKSFAIDGGAIRRNVEDGEKWGFDTRQCWNLDSYIPAMLYPRFKWLQENAHGYDASFKSEEEYNEKVIAPIIDALELHLVLYTIGDGDNIIDAYCDKYDISILNRNLIELRAMQRIKHGYYLIAKYLFGFWD